MVLIKIAFFFALFFLGCNDRIVEPYVISGRGLVYDSGPLAVDGCDWLISTDTNLTFHPSELPTEFLIDSLAVVFTYSPTNEDFTCGWGQKLPIINIVSIERE